MADSDIKAMNSALRSVMQSLPSARYIDIGCSSWGTVQQAIGWLPSFQTFLAVEPDPRNIAYLRKNGVPKGVELIECALSDFDGEADLILSDSDTRTSFNHCWSVSSSLLEPKEHFKYWDFVKFDRRVKVPVRTLSSICEERGIKGFDFIWGDAQGSERKIVNGSRSIIANTRYMFLEAELAEMYDGQWVRSEMLADLPEFEVLGEWEHDVLLRNKRL